MGYNFTVNGGMKVKVEGDYPWPWENDPNHMIRLFPSDVLTFDTATKTYTKQTGLCCVGIILTDDQVEPIGKPCHLRII